MSDLPPMDGRNMWPSLSKAAPPVRSSLLHNIDPTNDGAALRMGDYKLITGTYRRQQNNCYLLRCRQIVLKTS